MPCAGFVRNMRERGATEIHFLPPRFFAATAEESEGGSERQKCGQWIAGGRDGQTEGKRAMRGKRAACIFSPADLFTRLGGHLARHLIFALFPDEWLIPRYSNNRIESVPQQNTIISRYFVHCSQTDLLRHEQRRGIHIIPVCTKNNWLGKWNWLPKINYYVDGGETR